VEQFSFSGDFSKCLQVFKGFGCLDMLMYLCINEPGRMALKSFSTACNEETAHLPIFQSTKKIIMSFINSKISLSALFVIIAISFTCFTAQSQQLSNRKQGTVLEQLEQNSRSNMIDQVINYAYRFRGTPYRYGAMSPSGFDCSGFTSYVFKRFGINLDRSSRGQISDGVRVKKNDLQPGDLVFFQGRSGRGGVGHVGIVTKVNDDNTFHFIHSACSSGVTESKNTESYYSRRYVGACRVL
jgi:cell wall-associated NlpC family hydrolase